MRKFVVRLPHALLAAALIFSGAMALAVPKAAENEDEMVTFGEAGAPPKPAAKHLAPATKPPSGTAGRQSAGKPAKHAGSKASAGTGTRSAGKAVKPATKAAPRSQSGRPSAAHKEAGSARHTGQRSTTTPKASPVQQTSGKKNGTARKQ